MAIQEYKTAVEPQHETVIAGGVFIWRDLEPRRRSRKRREKKPKVRLKAVKCEGGINDRGQKHAGAAIPTKNTRSTPESSTALAFTRAKPPYNPV